MAITFFKEDTDVKIKPQKRFKNWLTQIALDHEYKIKDLNYIFCSDQYLHNINLEYLNHDTYTDIITFDNSEKEKIIEGDIFISWERVQENAHTNKVPSDIELLRVMSHGLLHLLGYKDKTKNQKLEMRTLEEKCILMFQET